MFGQAIFVKGVGWTCRVDSLRFRPIQWMQAEVRCIPDHPGYLLEVSNNDISLVFVVSEARPATIGAICSVEPICWMKAAVEGDL